MAQVPTIFYKNNYFQPQRDFGNPQGLISLLENMPINSLMTHSYGFHTANGRHIIETIKEKYYEYESTS